MGAKARGGCAYAVHPGADTEATAAAARPRYRVLRNDEVAQAIEHSGHVTAATLWAAGTRIKGVDAGRVVLSSHDGGIRLRIDTSGTAGTTMQFSLHR